jgi:hypothetical protein
VVEAGDGEVSAETLGEGDLSALGGWHEGTRLLGR